MAYLSIIPRSTAGRSGFCPCLRKSFANLNVKLAADETYIKVKGAWKYLYRAVDKEGRPVDFLLTARRDKAAALRFFLTKP